MNRKLLALYGLKFNPFAPELPTEALWIAPEVENFLWRIQFALVREGGFALITGESGSGKSVTLRLLSERLAAEPDLVVGAISRPQANVADFYRELGELFGVPLRPHNRWGGAKALRQRWTLHLDTTLLRPLLLVDEAQELDSHLDCRAAPKRPTWTPRSSKKGGRARTDALTPEERQHIAQRPAEARWDRIDPSPT